MSARVDFIALLRRAIGPILLCAIAALSVPAQAAGVAMVTDLQGKATAASEGRSRDLTILAELDAGTVVQLSAGAILVALYLDTGDEYVFKGPAAIDFKPGNPETRDGAKPQRRNLALGKGAKDIRIKPVGIAQGAMVMRSTRGDAHIQLLSLSRTRTLETQPEFRWSAPQPDLKYGFSLDDDTGGLVHEAQVTATSIKLPAGVQLKEGVPYTWRVSASLPGGRRYSSFAEFAIASAELRAQAEALRPAASAPLSSRIAYAAWLEQMELLDEARKYWKSAAAERPDDTRLKALAAQ
jgi:hypothetical protein